MLLQSQRQPTHQRELLFPPRSRSAQGPGHAPTWPARPVHLIDLPPEGHAGQWKPKAVLLAH